MRLGDRSERLLAELVDAGVRFVVVGGAAAVVACCDVVIATDAAFFSIPEVRIGVAPVGVTPPLVRAMGLVNYRRYALSGERIPAAEAHRIGLAGRLCKAAEVEVAVTETVEAFLQGAPAALRDLKAHLAKVYPETTDLLRAAAAHHEKFDAFSQPDALEGVAAFKEKRRPKWYPA